VHASHGQLRGARDGTGAAAPVSRNSGYDYALRLGPEAGEGSLVEFLARRYRHSSRAAWAASIDAGRVLLDGAPTTSEARPRPGQLLVWRRPPWPEPELPNALRVLFEDGDLLAIDKPAGLPTLPGAGFLTATLLHAVRRLAPEAAPLHRLGRWTSGVVLFARSRESRAHLGRQWAAREVVKRYRALASGSPSRDAFRVEAPIGPVPHPLLGTVHAAFPAGRPSTSDVVVLERRIDSFLCDVSIATGRPHQIRIHLAAAGHPLVGDPLFLAGGGVAADSRAVPGDPGYLLHAAELSFRHPRDGRTVTIASGPPQDLETAGLVPA
jgi:23S rRNA pseudouridine1911/1915/1917 synthase